MTCTRLNPFGAGVRMINGTKTGGKCIGDIHSFKFNRSHRYSGADRISGSGHEAQLEWLREHARKQPFFRTPKTSPKQIDSWDRQTTGEVA
jgi:hypothetical protein